jgi:FAD/FMN-containing dehydrogenase
VPGLTRRDFLAASGLAAWWPYGGVLAGSHGVLVNDLHSQLSATRVNRVVVPRSLDAVRQSLADARKERRAVCIAGGRHAMGTQAFATDGLLLDTRRLDRVLEFDAGRGLIEVESGMQWPALLAHLIESQRGRERAWTFAQKQTGADRLTIGGCVAANVHGRGLKMAPFVADVESFRLLDARGELVNCSRTENRELFSLATGGYGLFGFVYSVTLKLVPRRKLQRVVEIGEVGNLPSAFARRIDEGYLYGDFQYAIDARSDDFFRRGVFSCYRPVDDATPVPESQRELSEQHWSELLYLAHADKSAAFRQYADYYLSTSGQIYWSDVHQMSIYPEHYHAALDRRLKARTRASEIITEIYCERDALPRFFADVRDDFRRHGVDVVYGTVRLIEPDRESFLPWARAAYACTIFNLHVVHTGEGLRHAANAFRRLIDLGVKHGGSYYLTYHKYATRRQVETCYPRFAEFLRLKRKYDPAELFQSDWYRHYRRMFS